MEYHIQRAAWRDFGELIKVQRQITHGTEHLAATRTDRKDSLLYAFAKAFVHRKRVHTFVAKDEGRIVGHITVVFGKFLKVKGTAYIVMGVLESHRGRGIGTRLLAHTEELALAQGIHRMELEVFEKNEAAVRLYEKMGFVMEGRRREAIRTPGGYEDIMWMGKLLQSNVT